MHRSVRGVAGLATIILAAALGCRDLASPTGPDSLARSSHSSASLLGPAFVAPVERTVPLPTAVTWTFIAGPAGVVSSNAAVGLSVIVPPGALSSVQTITVTALEGSAVAYSFAPHLTFERSVTLVQDLSGTRAAGSLLPLLGAHFAGDVLEFTNGLVEVTETVPAIISLLDGQARFGVSHFTGWIVASGRDEDDPEEFPIDPGY